MCVFSLCVGVCGVGVGVCGVCYKAILPNFSPFSDFDLFKYNHKCYGPRPYFWKLVWAKHPPKTNLSDVPQKMGLFFFQVVPKIRSHYSF